MSIESQQKKKPISDPFSQFKEGDPIQVCHTVGHPSWGYPENSRCCFDIVEVGREHTGRPVPPMTTRILGTYIARVEGTNKAKVHLWLPDGHGKMPVEAIVAIGYVHTMDYE